MGFTFIFYFIKIPQVTGNLAVWDAEIPGLSRSGV